MLQELTPILEIQELDMKMIRLMGLKKKRQDEYKKLNSIKMDLKRQLETKSTDIAELKQKSKEMEVSVEQVLSQLKKLEARQGEIKKVEEFNALTHETSAAEKERHLKEQLLSDLYDKITEEEEIFNTITETARQTEENSRDLESEIIESIEQINSEGQELKKVRDELVKGVDKEVFAIYERLLRNKKDRVIVPIENRSCSGCHIILTAQHENVVRKGERLIFCEHCSRIHYWQDSEAIEGSVVATKRRRKTVAS